MRKYSEYPYASISMSKETKFIDALRNLFNQNKITHVLESGTFNGLGSTKTLAETIIATGTKIEKFVTIEVDPTFYKQAKANLAGYSFVTPVNGLSVNREEAISFVENDDAIRNHQKYPDVFIDDTNSPVSFYSNELKGRLSGKSSGGFFSNLFGKSETNTEFVESVFDKYLPEFVGHSPLILLDSAGGIGFLEYQKVKQILSKGDFFIILDDIHHLKHFRSKNDIETDSHYKMLDIDVQHGWLIAKYTK